MHWRPQAENETLQEYIQRLTDSVIHAIGTDPTSVTYHVIIVSLRKKLKLKLLEQKQLRLWAMILAKEAKIKPKRYKELNDYDSSAMQIISIPQSEVMPIQGKVYNQEIHSLYIWPNSSNSKN